MDVDGTYLLYLFHSLFVRTKVIFYLQGTLLLLLRVNEGNINIIIIRLRDRSVRECVVCGVGVQRGVAWASVLRWSAWRVAFGARTRRVLGSAHASRFRKRARVALRRRRCG